MLVTHNAFDHRHVSIDVDRDRLEYFHGCSLHTLGGNDFGGIFRLGEHVADVSVLPPYAETAKFDRARRLERVDLVDRATSIARLHIAAAPTANTVMRHAERSATDLDWLRSRPLASFQLYAFATVRQVGSCFGLTGAFLSCLDENGDLACVTPLTDRLAPQAEIFRCESSRARITHSRGCTREYKRYQSHCSCDSLGERSHLADVNIAGDAKP